MFQPERLVLRFPALHLPPFDHPPLCGPVFTAEMDMGWVHPWVGLGWVAFSSTCDGLGWVEWNEKYCGIVAEYCKTHTFHCP